MSVGTTESQTEPKRAKGSHRELERKPVSQREADSKIERARVTVSLGLSLAFIGSLALAQLAKSLLRMRALSSSG